jgi:hypothetical protein
VVGHYYREPSWPPERIVPYQVQLEAPVSGKGRSDSPGPKIYAPLDGDECIRTALRFPLGAAVECYLGDDEGWVQGVVVKLYHREESWEASKWAPYQVKLNDGSVGAGTLVWAPEDSDLCVRKGLGWPWPGYGK